MSTHETLLPCPFCGGEAKMHTSYMLSPLGGGTSIVCSAIDCPANPTVLSGTQEEAIAAWNRRAGPPAPAAPTEN